MIKLCFDNKDMNESDFGELIKVNICLQKLEELVKVIKGKRLGTESYHNIAKDLYRYRELEEFAMMEIQKLSEKTHDLASLTEINLYIDRLSEYGVDFQDTWDKQLWTIYEEAKNKEIRISNTLEVKISLIYKIQKYNRELDDIAEVSSSNEVSRRSTRIHPVSSPPRKQKRSMKDPISNKRDTLTDSCCKCTLW